MELFPNSMFSPDCEELFHKIQDTLRFKPWLWLKKKDQMLVILGMGI